MKKGLLLGFCLLLNILFVSINAQENVPESKVDSLPPTPLISLMVDTLSHKDVAELNQNAKLVVEEFKPDPGKAVLYSAIFPGLGQIYNRKYWKLPIVYGGFLGVVYAVTWNGNLHNDYGKAYKDIITNPKGTTSWQNFVPGGDIEGIQDNPVRMEQTISSLKRRRDYFRRNRDLAIIVGVGLYALCMIDAYVDAQLYDFDMSPDLSMTVAPVIWGPTGQSSTTVGIQCSIYF